MDMVFGVGTDPGPCGSSGRALDLNFASERDGLIRSRLFERDSTTEKCSFWLVASVSGYSAWTCSQHNNNRNPARALRVRAKKKSLTLQRNLD